MATHITPAEAHATIVKWMRRAPLPILSQFGYEVYIPGGIFVDREQSRDQGEFEKLNMPVLCDAAWTLCRRGYLAPGTFRPGAGSGTTDGHGFTVTPLGRAWLKNKEGEIFIPTEPNQIGQMLGKYKGEFGDGFHERAQQAVICYDAQAYLACCAMSGAASESILLSLATAKSNEEHVLKIYIAARGRSSIEKLVFHSNDVLWKKAAPGLELLKYWRDDAAHGKATHISQDTAFTSLLLLLRFAALAKDNWAELAAPIPSGPRTTSAP